MLDWQSESDRMPGGRAYLHHDTLDEARGLLEKALKRCIELKRTKGDPIGSPACWATLLAQQAHANLHGWEMDEAFIFGQNLEYVCS